MEEIIENTPSEISTVEEVNVEVTPFENISVSESNTPVVIEEIPATIEKKPHKRVLQGKVVSNKANKTITVKVERQVAHPLYKKYYKVSKKFMAHDENNDCKIGDTVRIRESRPLSAMKRWTLIEIIERAK